MNLQTHRIAPLLLVLAMAGCRTLPNVSRFSEATTQMYVAVQTAGANAVAEVAAAEKGIAGVSNQLSAAVAKNWQPAVVAAKAVARYSGSLRTLVESGQHGETNAREALAAVDTLVKSVAGAFPGGDAVASGVITGVAKTWGLVARELAARSLGEVIEKTDPHIQDLASALSQEFIALANLIEGTEAQQLKNLMMKHNEPRARLNTYEGIRTRLLAQMISGDGEFTSDTNLLARWQWVEKLLESERQQPWYRDYVAERLCIEARLQAQQEVARKTPALLNAWAASHQELLKVVRAKGAPDFTELVTLSQDLWQTYEQTKTRVEAIKAEALKGRL
jgi:hypothetical protein